MKGYLFRIVLGSVFFTVSSCSLLFPVEAPVANNAATIAKKTEGKSLFEKLADEVPERTKETSDANIPSRELPEKWQDFAGMASTFAEKKSFDKAFMAYQEILENLPLHPKLLEELTWLCSDNKELNEKLPGIRSKLQEYSSLYPQDIKARDLLLTMSELHDEKEAYQSLLIDMVNENPNDGLLWIRLGNVAMGDSDLKGASACLQRAEGTTTQSESVSKSVNAALKEQKMLAKRQVEEQIQNQKEEVARVKKALREDFLREARWSDRSVDLEEGLDDF